MKRCKQEIMDHKNNCSGKYKTYSIHAFIVSKFLHSVTQMWLILCDKTLFYFFMVYVDNGEKQNIKKRNTSNNVSNEILSLFNGCFILAITHL